MEGNPKVADPGQRRLGFANPSPMRRLRVILVAILLVLVIGGLWLQRELGAFQEYSQAAARAQRLVGLLEAQSWGYARSTLTRQSPTTSVARYRQESAELLEELSSADDPRLEGALASCRAARAAVDQLTELESQGRWQDASVLLREELEPALQQARSGLEWFRLSTLGELASRRTRLQQAMSLGALLCLLGFVGVLAEAHAQDRQLRQANERLQELLDRLVDTQEEERKLVARDLHDGMLQYVLAAELQLQVFRGRLNEEDAQPLHLGMERLRSAVDEGRRLIHNLRPAALDQFGLVEALRLKLGELETENGWTVAFDTNLEDHPVPSALETTIFRVIQEALTNAKKHSGTDEVAVAVNHKNGELRLLVQDWGEGFDPAGDFPGSVGLSSMRERAELMGGWIRIDSEPGRGTRLEAGLPLV